jgi:hypothetical protein
MVKMAEQPRGRQVGSRLPVETDSIGF